MSFKEMQFKGNLVFVEVDDRGEIILEKGRARMKYRLDDDRIYNPNVANLIEVGPDASRLGAPSTATPRASQRSRTKKAVKSAPPPAVSDGTAIIAYTDGACSGNPGPAGLGFTIRFPDGRFIKQGEPLGNATNNIAELTAVLRVLDHIGDKDAHIVIHTDSSYSIGVLCSGWKAKANQTLIATIRSALRQFKNVEFRKVKGHAGIEDNELVDKLAREAAETQLPV